MQLLSLRSDREVRPLFRELFLGHSGCLPTEDKPLSVSLYRHEMQWRSSAAFNSSRSSPIMFITAEAPFSTSLPRLAASGEHLRALGWSHNNEAFVASSILGEEEEAV